MSDTLTEKDPVPTETERLTALLSESPAAPIDCSDEALASVDFSRLDVLVGTVRSDGQFDYCIRTGTYYVPAKTLTPEELPLSWVALYEEGLSRRAGIKRYGEVTEIRVVKRCDIPVPLSRDNPDEAYYLFTVASWQYLDRPIAIKDTRRGKPMLTNRFLLESCSRSYQLIAIRSPEEYRLCQLLCGIAEELDTDTPVLRRVGERHILSVADHRLRLLDVGGHCLYTCPAEMLDPAPAEVLRGVARGLGLRT